MAELVKLQRDAQKNQKNKSKLQAEMSSVIEGAVGKPAEGADTAPENKSREVREAEMAL